MEDTIDSAVDGDLEEETDAEVDKVLAELAGETAAQLAAAPRARVCWCGLGVGCGGVLVGWWGVCGVCSWCVVYRDCVCIVVCCVWSGYVLLDGHEATMQVCHIMSPPHNNQQVPVVQQQAAPEEEEGELEELHQRLAAIKN